MFSDTERRLLENVFHAYIHLFSAAHCLKVSLSNNDTLHSNVLVVAFGRFSLREWREYGTLNREVLAYRIHPDYAHGNTADSDLAILILRTPVEYNPFIKPICLWSGSIDLQNVVSKIGYVVGWGQDEFGNPYTSEPRMAMAPIVSQVRIFIDSEPVSSLSVFFAIIFDVRVEFQWQASNERFGFFKNKSSET